jgi:hypothetical protein
MSLVEIYQLLIDENENDYINNNYLKSEDHINNILKLLENYINNLIVFNDEELEFIPMIIEKLNDIKDNYSNKTTNRIKRFINKSEKMLQNNSESEDISEINETQIVIKKNRTDTNLIPPESIMVVDDSVRLFESIIKEELISNSVLDDFFRNQKCVIVNSCIKDKTNLYGLDKYGLVIRRKSYMKKNNIYGWKYDSNMEPVHILTKPELCNESENIKNVINAQFMMDDKLFKQNGVIYKIYSRYYPERLIMLGIN